MLPSPNRTLRPDPCSASLPWSIGVRICPRVALWRGADRTARVRGKEIDAQPSDHGARVVFVQAVKGETVIEQYRRPMEDVTGHLKVHLGPLPGYCLCGRQKLIERWPYGAGRHTLTLAERPPHDKRILFSASPSEVSRVPCAPAPTADSDAARSGLFVGARPASTNTPFKPVLLYKPLAATVLNALRRADSTDAAGVCSGRGCGVAAASDRRGRIVP